MFRKYFGCYFGHTVAIATLGETSVGMNPLSEQWNMVMTRLKAKGDRFLNGDYSNYDSTMTLQLGQQVAWLVNQFYNDGEENARVRKTLMATVFSGDHVIGRSVYATMQGLPSGIAGTSIINSDINSLLVRMAYSDIEGKPISQFRQQCDFICYGDDNVLAVRRDVEKFNMKSYSEWCADFGITYTSVDKDDNMKEYYAFDELSYLKRKNCFDEELKLWVGRVSEETLFESLRWTTRRGFENEDLRSCVRSIMDEMAMFDKNRFKACKKKLHAIAKDAQKHGIEFRDLLTVSRESIRARQFK